MVYDLLSEVWQGLHKGSGQKRPAFFGMLISPHRALGTLFLLKQTLQLREQFRRLLKSAKRRRRRQRWARS